MCLIARSMPGRRSKHGVGAGFALLVLACVTLLFASESLAVTAKTKLMSKNTAGFEGNDNSGPFGGGGPWITPRGRFVVFTSNATNLVLNDTNGVSDVFVRDRETGKTKRVSVNSRGRQANDGSETFSAMISANGRYIVFSSRATNLVRNDTNAVADVFVRDRRTGKTRRVSINSRGRQANGASGDASISADGRLVLFDSEATNLVRGDSNGVGDVFVHNLVTGKTSRVSVNSAGVQGNDGSFYASISADGRFVAFGSAATNLVAHDTNAVGDIFVRDRKRGKTKRASVSSTGIEMNAGSSSEPPSISADGRFVVFDSRADNLVPNDTNGFQDVFIRDLRDRRTRLISLSSSGGQGNEASEQGFISGNDRFVVFRSSATNFAAADTNSAVDVFVRDRKTGKTRRVSVASGGAQANGGSGNGNPAITADGRFVVFVSSASNLVQGDTNAHVDVFLRGPLR
jgi:Tol biopolymer transport system component